MTPGPKENGLRHHEGSVPVQDDAFRMPFELHGAAATSQRPVDTILSHCEGYTLAYIDDILVYSRTWTQHLYHLAHVFQRLQAAGLKINPKKSKLRFTCLDYLEFTIGDGLVQPQTKKVSAIHNVPRPCTKKQLRQFLGLAGYYRCFVPHFVSIAAPLTDCLGHGCPKTIQWDADAPQSLEYLRRTRCSSPVLYNTSTVRSSSRLTSRMWPSTPCCHKGIQMENIPLYI